MESLIVTLHQITEEERINEFVEILIQEQAQDHTGLLRYLLIKETDFRLLPHYFGKVYEIRNKDRQIGYLWGHSFQKVVQVFFLYVAPSHRGVNFGAQALHLLEQEYADHEEVQVILHQSKKWEIAYVKSCEYSQVDCDERTGFCKVKKGLAG